LIESKHQRAIQPERVKMLLNIIFVKYACVYCEILSMRFVFQSA